MTSPRPARAFDWEEAGRAFGQTLDGYHAVVVIGNDPVATGRVAIGLAREQAALRHVAVGDLFAESAPIQELVSTDEDQAFDFDSLVGTNNEGLLGVLEGEKGNAAEQCAPADKRELCRVKEKANEQ